MSADDSALLWTSLSPLNSWAIGGGALFGGCVEAAACALDADTGDLLWRTQHELPGCTTEPPAISSDCRGIVANGVAYFYRHGIVHAFDAATGEHKASFPGVGGDPIVVDGSLVGLTDTGVRSYQLP
jgi:outer membrane protein assembly factor BamB